MLKPERVPVHEPELGDEEIAAVVAALHRGEISGTFGQAIPEFEAKFAEFCGCEHGIAVSSGTGALQLAVAAAGIGDGEEVLVSASTNIATALAAYHNNAIPVPVDSEEQTWNLDPNLLEGLITPKTRAIIPVHLFGHPADMNTICSIARQHRLTVIEDCAESHGATLNGKMTGSFGDMGCFSFYANKIITTGEGGMVVTNDVALAKQLRLLRNLAFASPRFYHKKAGFNFRMAGYQAAMGLAQLAKIREFIAQKRRVAQTYNRFLAGVPGLMLPPELPNAFNVYWMYAVRVQSEFGLTRDQLASMLADEGIESRTFFCPINQQPFLQEQKGYRVVACPVADKLWEEGLYLPSANKLEESTIERICSVIKRLSQ